MRRASPRTNRLSFMTMLAALAQRVGAAPVLQTYAPMSWGGLVQASIVFRAYKPSKYMPHQGARECARRIRQGRALG